MHSTLIHAFKKKNVEQPR